MAKPITTHTAIAKPSSAHTEQEKIGTRATWGDSIATWGDSLFNWNGTRRTVHAEIAKPSSIHTEI